MEFLGWACPEHGLRKPEDGPCCIRIKFEHRCIREGCTSTSASVADKDWVQLKVTRDGQVLLEGMACPDHWAELLDHPERGRRPDSEQE